MSSFLRTLWIFILLLTIQRLFFLGLNFESWKDVHASELALTLLSGLRFDLMVTGYCGTLLLFLLVPASWLKIASFSTWYRLFYSVSAFILFSLILINFFDLLWFHLYADKFSAKHSLAEFLSLIPADLFLLLSSLFAVVTFAFSFRTILLEKSRAPQKPLLRKQIPILLLMLALMIRSSLGQHHLDLRHADVTNSQFLNMSCVPSAYALDQALRNRR